MNDELKGITECQNPVARFREPCIQKPSLEEDDDGPPATGGRPSPPDYEGHT